jgi:hypothetical protein
LSVQEMDALIVRHLKDIESASSRLQKEIQKNVGKVIDDVIESWSQARDWILERNFDEASTWIAPKNWRVPDTPQARNEFYCWFGTDTQNGERGENVFWLTQLCGLGVCPLGLRWTCEYGKLGLGKGAWKTLLESRVLSIRRFNSEVQQRCIDDMAEHRGWGKGRGQGRKLPAAMRA